MRYVFSRWRMFNRDEAYRIYLTDTLYCLSRQQMLSERWIDLMNKKIDSRSAEEIAEDVLKRAGLKVGE